MSAFICSDLHIFTIANFAAERITHDLHYVDPQRFTQDLADRLKRANVQSVNYRYSEKTPARKCKPIKDTTPAPAPVIYRLFECWIYQSCEDSNALDFYALRALIETVFTPEDIEQSKNLSIWSI